MVSVSWLVSPFIPTLACQGRFGRSKRGAYGVTRVFSSSRFIRRMLSIGISFRAGSGKVK